MKLHLKIFAGIVFCLILYGITPLVMVSARQDNIRRPLIQTTTFRDEYEGMVSYGGTYIRALDYADIEEAYERVKSGIVKINTSRLHGSGVIWELNEAEIVIASSAHLLTDWDTDSYIMFGNGTIVSGEIMLLSESYDLGFLKIGIDELTYEELVGCRQVGREVIAYETLQDGDAVFSVGSSDGVALDRYEATVASAHWYIKEFDSYMLYCFGYAKPGMSGGGTFDTYGNFLGMLSGGTGGGETVSLPVTVMKKEYEDMKKNDM